MVVLRGVSKTDSIEARFLAESGQTRREQKSQAVFFVGQDVSPHFEGPLQQKVVKLKRRATLALSNPLC
jgi:hypothetical protein